MAFWDDLFGGGSSNQGAFNDYANQMRDQAQMYQPWVGAGQTGLGRSMGEYDKLLNNPNFLQDMIAGGFYESPYQKYMQDMVTKRMNFNSANTGMLGSGAANRALQGELTNMTGQFMNDYINRGMGSYQQGLGGMAGLSQQGMGALNDMSGIMNEAAGGQLQGAISANDAKQRGFGNLLGGIGGLLTLPFGGMGGGAMGGGSLLQKGLGSLFGSQSNPKASTFDLGYGRSY